MKCPSCQQPVQTDWQVCQHCKTQLVDVDSSNPYAAPVDQQFVEVEPDEFVAPEGDSGNDITAVIPYKNPKALFAYYSSIAGGLPLLGFPFAVTAFVLGILGLRDRKRNPKIRGAVHAWIGIGCGGFFALFWLLMIVTMIVTAISAA